MPAEQETRVWTSKTEEAKVERGWACPDSCVQPASRSEGKQPRSVSAAENGSCFHLRSGCTSDSTHGQLHSQ
eukprot:3602236-Karenia_brevis.AAC.1